MAIFNSYVSLPDGTQNVSSPNEDRLRLTLWIHVNQPYV